VLADLQKASDVIQPEATPEPVTPEPPKVVAEPSAPSVDAVESQMGLYEILAIRRANAREHTLQRNYRMPVSLLDEMEKLSALGYELSAMVVAGTRLQVEELKKKHGIK
jgi:hypothetical protein